MSDAKTDAKLDALKKACEGHAKLSKACATGQGHDRHLYALHNLWKKMQAVPSSTIRWCPPRTVAIPHCACLGLVRLCQTVLASDTSSKTMGSRYVLRASICRPRGSWTRSRRTCSTHS